MEERINESEIDLTVLRLKFEVFLRGQTKYDVPLTPVYSEPIYNATVYPSLTICRLSRCSCSTNGGETLLLFCDKVNKDDIAVRFFEEINGKIVWEAFGTSLHVHRKVGISLETPKYRGPSMRGPIMCFIQLKRISDGETSEPRQFDYTPIFPNDFDSIELKRKRAKLDPVFQKFLNVEDSGTSNRLNILPNPQMSIQQPNITLPTINYDMFPVGSSDNIKIQESNPFYLEADKAPSYDIFPGTSTDYRIAPSPPIYSQENCFVGNNFTTSSFEGQQNPNFIQNFNQTPIDSEIIPREGFSDELLAFVNEVIENNLDEEKKLSGRLENLMLDLMD